MAVKKKVTTKKKTTPRKKAAPRVRTPVKKKTPVKNKSTKKAAARKPRKISDRDKIFIDNWLGGADELRGNATACYQNQHPKTARRSCEVSAEKIMRKIEVQEYLQAKLKKVEEKTDINAAYVLQKSAEFLEMCLGNVEVNNDIIITGDNGKKVVIEAHAKQFNAPGVGKALELIGKNISVQAFQEKIDISGKLDLGALMAKRQKAVEKKAAGGS